MVSAEISSIPVVCVSYNSSELIYDLLFSFRKFYSNKVFIIDGSDSNIYLEIRDICEKFPNVELIHFEYNIHHGPGMAWAIQNLNLSGQVLFLDSDIVVLKPGFIESLKELLPSNIYGVGMVNYVNEEGFDVDYYQGAIPYLHPACMLCNIDKLKEWPLPIKHGAPMIESMLAIYKQGKSNLVANAPWIQNDFKEDTIKKFLRHDWQGTVKRTGGYHLEEWQNAAQYKANFDNIILKTLPRGIDSLIQIECGNGALVRAYKRENSSCTFIGVDSDYGNTQLASTYCDQVYNLALNDLTSSSLEIGRDAACWILVGAINESVDPRKLLNNIRSNMKSDSCLIISVANFQHWKNLVSIASGDLEYGVQDSAFSNSKQVRFFSRTSIIKLFDECRFQIAQGIQLSSSQSMDQTASEMINKLASLKGQDAGITIQDTTPTDYVFILHPK